MLHPPIVAAQDRNSGQPSPAAPAHTADDPHKVLNFNESAAHGVHYDSRSRQRRSASLAAPVSTVMVTAQYRTGTLFQRGTVTAPAAG
jgi:hypothetical protein